MRTTGIYLIAITAALLWLAGCSRESADWKSATTADTSEAYQQFLQQHPRSSSAQAAKARLAALAEDRDWQAAAAVDTRAAYEQFVTHHASSKWVQEARIRIENFAQAGGSVAAAAATPSPKVVSPSVPPAAGPAPHAAATKPATAKGAAPAAVHGNFVQLGAFSSREKAQSEWKTLAAKYPSELKSLKPDYVEGASKHGNVFRLRVSVPSVAAARGLCGALKKHSQLCVPITA